MEERLSAAKAKIVAKIETLFTDEELKQVALTNQDFVGQIFDLLSDADGAVTARFAASKAVRLLALLSQTSSLCERTTQLFLRHINEFRGGAALPAWHFDVLAIMLRGLCDACVHCGAECQKAMCEGNAFVVLFRLLSLGLNDEERRFAVFDDVLYAMYGLLLDSREGRYIFSSEGYFTQLLNALEDYPNFSTTHKVAIADRLYEILIGTRLETSTNANAIASTNINTNEGDENNSVQIKSEAKVPLIKHALMAIALIRCLGIMQGNLKEGDADVAEHVAKKRLGGLLVGSPLHNISALCAVGATTEILAVLDAANKTQEAQSAPFTACIEAPLIAAVQTLGQHSMTPSDLKRIVRILSYSGECETRIPSFPLYVEALKAMARSHSGPSEFYYFDGVSSVKKEHKNTLTFTLMMFFFHRNLSFRRLRNGLFPKD